MLGWAVTFLVIALIAAVFEEMHAEEPDVALWALPDSCMACYSSQKALLAGSPLCIQGVAYVRTPRTSLSRPRPNVRIS
jgi:hypothetical protein